MTSTLPSTSFRTFARASSAPLTPHRYDSVPGYGACWMNGPDTYIVGPGILPALMRSRVEMLGVERSAEIARAGDAGEQQLLRRGRKDHRLERRRIGLVPVVVVGVPDDLQVHVHVPQPGQHGHPFRGNHLGAGGHRERADLADGANAIAVDDDDAVLHRPAAVAVDQRAADERFHRARLSVRDASEQTENDRRVTPRAKCVGAHVFWRSPYPPHDRSSSAREMFVESAPEERRPAQPKLIRMCRGDSKKRPGTTSVEYRLEQTARQRVAVDAATAAAETRHCRLRG